jgi:hypothetical protein
MNSSEPDRPTPERRIFYLAGLLTTLVGVAAISLAVQSYGFLLLAGSLTAVGHLVSSRLRAQGRSLRIVETVVITICLATYARLFATGDTSPLLSPGIALFHKELSLAVMLVWAEVVRSFSLVSDEAVMFSAVPSLALIGVVATTSTRGDVILFFTAWLAFSILMFVESGRKTTTSRGGQKFRSVTFSATLAIGAVLAGSVVSPLVQHTAMWGFVKLAPTLSANREPLELPVGEGEGNVLEISEGPVRLSSREEMRVRASAPAYWRTRVWDIYSGRDWKSHAPLTPRLPSSSGFVENQFQAWTEEDRGPTTQLVQQFYSPSGFRGYLHAAGEPAAFWIASSDLYRDSFNCWRLPRLSGPPITEYRVVSYISTATPDQLRNAGSDYPPEVERFRNRNDATFRVRMEAERITRGLDNDYDRVMALRKYLARHCVYDLQTPPLPKDQDDAVEYFLFESRRGYCDVFASALAVMARSLGIPARIATGFMPGDFDEERGEYVVRDRDRHSWAEIYFPGYGWQAVEATPSGDVTPQDFWSSLMSELRFFYASGNARFALLLATLGFALLALRVVFPAAPLDPEGFAPRRLSAGRRRARALWRDLAVALRRHGVTVSPATTPLEMADAFEALNGGSHPAAEAVRCASELLSEALYGPGEPTPGQLEDLGIACRWARRELSRPAGRRTASNPLSVVE